MTLDRTHVLKCVNPCETHANFDILHKAVQEFHVLAIANELANHFFVQSGVFSEPLGHLVVVHGVGEEAFLLQELDSFLRLLIKLLCACDQQLKRKAV